MRLNVFKKIFKNKQSNIVIIQKPNIPLWGWFVSTVLAKFSSGTFNPLFSNLALGFIFTWAYLEVTKGDSYFRRVLGMGVLIVAIYSKTN